MEFLSKFFNNLLIALLGVVVLGGILFAVSPETTKGILQVYSGLGLLPVIAVLLVLWALPKRERRD